MASPHDVASFLRQGRLSVPGSLAATVSSSATAVAAAAAGVPPPADGDTMNKRGAYVGGLPPDLVLLAAVLCGSLLLLLPNLFTPLVLLGLIDARTPFTLQAALIGLLLVALVASSVVRVAVRLRRRRYQALLVCVFGGVCVFSLISFQAAAVAYAFDGFVPAAVEPALFSTDALLFHAAACLALWLVARRSHAPAAHLAHYVASTLLFNALCCRVLIALERHDPVRALEAALQEEIEPILPVAAAAVDGLGLARWLPSSLISAGISEMYTSENLGSLCLPKLPTLPPAWKDADALALLATLLLRLSGHLLLRGWWFFGLSYGRLRYAACVFNIAVVGGRHASIESIDLSIYLSIYISIYLNVYLSIYVCMYVCVCMHLLIRLSIYLSVHNNSIGLAEETHPHPAGHHP